MKVIVVDWNGKFLEAFDGTYKEGVLVHKRGQTQFSIFKWGGKNEEMEFDYQKTIDAGKERMAIYEWDGKNVHQLTVKEAPESSTLSDFKNAWENAKMADDAAIKPPEDKIWKWVYGISIIALIFATVVMIYTVSSAGTQIAKATQSSSLGNITRTFYEETNYMIQFMNRTQQQQAADTAYIINASRYISTH